MASLQSINVIGSLFSVYFYTWLHPDLNANVRIGLNQFKVDHAVYFGTIVWIFFSTCVFAPKISHRSCALVGNVGMAVCCITVIVNHYLLEKKWVWAGLMYVINIWAYSAFMGFCLMGHNSKYHYDRNRLVKLIIPVVSTLGLTVLCYGWMQETRYSDVMPWVAFNFFTIMAILAQVAAPRTAVWNFFEFLNRAKGRNTSAPSPVKQNNQRGRNRNRRR